MAFDFLELAHRRRQESPTDFAVWSASDRETTGDRQMVKDQDIWTKYWRGLDAMCRLEYWTRTWIVQEVLVASKIVIFTNDRVVSWTGLEAVCNALQALSREYLIVANTYLQCLRVCQHDLSDIVSPSKSSSFGPHRRLAMRLYDDSSRRMHLKSAQFLMIKSMDCLV